MCILTSAEAIRVRLGLPRFRLTVHDDGHVSVCCSREHEAAVKAPTVDESVMRWMALHARAAS